MGNNEVDTRPVMVSIRCLVYNHEPYLRQCLDGFIMQKTNFRFEAIVHDDASTDGSAAIICEYAEKYPEIIKPIFETENQYSKQNGSIGKIMDNACIGKYIAYCEGDDYWIDARKLQKQVDILEEKQNVSMVYTGFENVNEKSNVICRPKYEYMMKKSYSGDIFPLLVCGSCFILTCTVCVRREVLFSELYQKAPCRYDYMLFVCASNIGDCVYIPKRMAAYRQTPTGAMATQAKQINNGYKLMKDYIFKSYLTSITKQYKGLTNIKICFSALDFARRNDSIIMYLKRHKELFLYIPFYLLCKICNKIVLLKTNFKS